MKTFNEIFIEAEKDRITNSVAKCWIYCFKWAIISAFLIAFWPWEVPSYWILTVFLIISGINTHIAIQQMQKLDEKGLDLSELSGIVSILDRNRER